MKNESLPHQSSAILDCKSMMLRILERKKTSCNKQSSGCSLQRNVSLIRLSMGGRTGRWVAEDEGKNSSMSMMDQIYFGGPSTSGGFVGANT